MSTRHHNNLTPAEAERLALLAEECAEVVQACTKILRHGYESSHPFFKTPNRESLTKEIGDVVCALGIIYDAGDVDVASVLEYRNVKFQNVYKYLHHQRKP